MSDKTNLHVVCDPDGAPMRAFTDKMSAKAWVFALKQSQPQAKYKVTECELQGDLSTALFPDLSRLHLQKVHVVLDKKRRPHIAYVDYRLAKSVGTANKGFTRSPLILDRSEFDV